MHTQSTNIVCLYTSLPALPTSSTNLPSFLPLFPPPYFLFLSSPLLSFSPAPPHSYTGACRLNIKDQQLLALQSEVASLKGLHEGAKEEVKGREEQIKRLERKLVFVTKVRTVHAVRGQQSVFVP